jgi:hypothetical protein
VKKVITLIMDIKYNIFPLSNSPAPDLVR